MLRFATACVAILMSGIAAAQPAAPPAGAARVTPGELIVEPPTLINLGFEWLIEGDVNRNAKCSSVVPQGRPFDFAQGKRQRVEGRIAAAALAGRTRRAAERVRSRLAEHVRRQHPRPRARHRLRGALRAERSGWRDRPAGQCDQDGDRAHASGAEAGGGRHGVSRLPGRPHGSEDRTGVHRHHVRLQLLLRRGRHRTRRTAARQAGRRDPGPRRHLRVSLRALRQPDHHQRHHHVRRHLLPDGRRHRREADRDQGGGRRRGRASTGAATSISSTSRPPTTTTSRASRSGTPTSRSGPARSSSPGRKD